MYNRRNLTVIAGIVLVTAFFLSQIPGSPEPGGKITGTTLVSVSGTHRCRGCEVVRVDPDGNYLGHVEYCKKGEKCREFGEDQAECVTAHIGDDPFNQIDYSSCACEFEGKYFDIGDITNYCKDICTRQRQRCTREDGNPVWKDIVGTVKCGTSEICQQNQTSTACVKDTDGVGNCGVVDGECRGRCIPVTVYDNGSKVDGTPCGLLTKCDVVDGVAKCVPAIEDDCRCRSDDGLQAPPGGKGGIECLGICKEKVRKCFINDDGDPEFGPVEEINCYAPYYCDEELKQCVLELDPWNGIYQCPPKPSDSTTTTVPPLNAPTPSDSTTTTAPPLNAPM